MYFLLNFFSNGIWEGMEGIFQECKKLNHLVGETNLCKRSLSKDDLDKGLFFNTELY